MTVSVPVEAPRTGVRSHAHRGRVGPRVTVIAPCRLPVGAVACCSCGRTGLITVTFDDGEEFPVCGRCVPAPSAPGVVRTSLASSGVVAAGES